jgi:siderophore synthetase component
VTNIVNFPSLRLLSGEPRERAVLAERILTDALGCQDMFRSLFLVSVMEDGSLYIADTQEHFADTLLTMERAKQALMQSFADDRLSSDEGPEIPA